MTSLLSRRTGTMFVEVCWSCCCQCLHRPFFSHVSHDESLRQWCLWIWTNITIISLWGSLLSISMHWWSEMPDLGGHQQVVWQWYSCSCCWGVYSIFSYINRTLLLLVLGWVAVIVVVVEIWCWVKMGFWVVVLTTPVCAYGSKSVRNRNDTLSLSSVSLICHVGKW